VFAAGACLTVGQDAIGHDRRLFGRRRCRKGALAMISLYDDVLSTVQRNQIDVGDSLIGLSSLNFVAIRTGLL